MYQTLFDELMNELFYLNKDVFKFESPISRVYEAYSIKDSKVLLTLNLLGISPEDINIEIKTNSGGFQILSVKAITENKIINKKYKYTNEFTVGSTRREVESFDWEAKDGILYVVLKYKELAKTKELKSARDSGLLNSLAQEIEKKIQEQK
jgi:HSP20 family molecular chaperone IbpA